MPKNPNIKKVLVIGSGPIVIGQAAEFDYAGTQACRALKEDGIEIILVNSNPATIMTDQVMADKIYIEPLTLPIIQRIIEKEKHGKIPAAFGSGNIRLFHKYISLAVTQILDYRLFRAFSINGKNALTQRHLIWTFDLHILCKGFQRSKTLVSGSGTVSTFGFQIGQKFEDKIA